MWMTNSVRRLTSCLACKERAQPAGTKGEQELAELGANTDATHSWTKLFQICLAYVSLFHANEIICIGGQRLIVATWLRRAREVQPYSNINREVQADWKEGKRKGRSRSRGRGSGSSGSRSISRGRSSSSETNSSDEENQDRSEISCLQANLKWIEDKMECLLRRQIHCCCRGPQCGLRSACRPFLINIK
jgi:hypothetical protein